MRRVTVRFGLEGAHHMLRRALIGLCIGFIITGACLFTDAIQSGLVPPPMLQAGGGAILIIIAITVAVNTYSIVDIVLMDEDFIWIRGPKEPFLSSLPIFPRTDPESITKIRQRKRA